ncbi:MAG: zinc-dependent peptidase [Myxococcota bacterium]|nr:zinc-dependent peptidase [Myxococcota bacterium]
MDRDLPPALSPWRALLSALVGAAVGGFVHLRFDAAVWVGPATGLAVAAAAYWIATRKDRRRRRVATRPFPAAWRDILEEWVGFYRDLDAPGRRRFEREVAIFLDEQVITGPRGAALDDELRLLVAASAVVVVFGRPGFRYPQLRDVVVYDQAFDDEYNVKADGNILGMVHGQGPILFSARSLRQGFRGEHDGRNVGYHEFAHVLDFEYGRADGVPGFMPWGAIQPWLEQMHAETAKIEKHRSVLRQYAAENEAEFFAVATEVFFERPEQLKKKAPELYALLTQAYGQDPAST